MTRLPDRLIDYGGSDLLVDGGVVVAGLVPVVPKGSQCFLILQRPGHGPSEEGYSHEVADGCLGFIHLG